MDKPLTGVRIIELATHGACPSAGEILNGWGAEIIKVEAISGDAARMSGFNFGVPVTDTMNPHFDFLNTGKKSIALDLKTEKGSKIMSKLIDSSDVLLTNMRNHGLKHLGLDYDAIVEKHPNVIWAHLTGFGEEGPNADDAGFDTVAYYARPGAMLDFAEKNTAPINAPFGVGDLSAGSTLAGGIAAALYQKARTGKGSKVTISLYGQSIWSLGIVLQSIKHGAQYPKSRTEAAVPLNNSYQCADGEWLYISVLQYDRYFKEFCTAIERADLIDDTRYNTLTEAKKHNKELIEIISESFKRHTLSEWMKRLDATDIAYNQINHIRDVLYDEQALVNNYINTVQYEDGNESVTVAPPLTIGSQEPIRAIRGPKLSENAGEILASIGITEDEIEELYEEGIVVRK